MFQIEKFSNISIFEFNRWEGKLFESNFWQNVTSFACLLHFSLIIPLVDLFKSILSSFTDLFVSKRLYQVLTPNILELHNWFFSTQMFKHFEHLIVHHFGNSFWQVKVVHLQHHMFLTWIWDHHVKHYQTL